MGKISLAQGKGNQMHNTRGYGKYGRDIPDHIDVSRSHENVTLVNIDVKQAYKDIFGEALEEYNAKQKRSDRKIADYYEHIKKSKNGEKLFHEEVLQWGSVEDFKNEANRQMAKEALVKYVETFEERNPNLKLIGAYVHMDEASPHLHLDYIPIARGYKNGLQVRNSLDKAIKQMGIVPVEEENRKNNATKLWKERERAYFKQLCEIIGLHVEKEEPSNRRNLSVAEYKIARASMIGDLEKERDQLKNEFKTLKMTVNRTAKSVKALDKIEYKKSMFSNEVKISVEDFNALKAKSAQFIVNQENIKLKKELDKREKNIVKQEKELKIRDIELTSKEAEYANKEKQIEYMHAKAINLYHQQLDLNEIARNLSLENESLKNKVNDLEGRLSALKRTLDALKNELTTVWQVFKKIGMSLSELRYGDSKYKINNLEPKTKTFLQAIENYLVKFCKSFNKTEIAEQIESQYGIASEVKTEINKLDKAKHRGMER